MAKVIRNPIVVKIVQEDNVLTCSAYYGVSCEEYPDLEIRKPIPITLKYQTLNDVDEEIMVQINAEEGIA